ncbi:protein rogdi-like [Mytilus galloprovincialis]|uniref:protein rogdi-like n=1 Tax=Mytilus galloprovincialis TaxID=29158 RepID=UPI003F7CB38E
MEEEAEVLRKELKWILEDQVHKVLQEVQHTLQECSRRFPIRCGLDENKSLVVPHRILLSSPNGGSTIKCVVTLLGDSICDADINFKHKQAKDHHNFKTTINPEVSWKLQQIQDAGNYLVKAMFSLNQIDKDHVFHSAKEVCLLLDELISSLNQGRSCLAYPKRKSIEDIIYSRNMQILVPPVPNDTALSFYIHSSKLIMSLYSINMSSQGRTEITSRQQIECTVQWLNEAVMLFTLALQQCQQLKDKISILKQYEEVS